MTMSRKIMTVVSLVITLVFIGIMCSIFAVVSNESSNANQSAKSSIESANRFKYMQYDGKKITGAVMKEISRSIHREQEPLALIFVSGGVIDSFGADIVTDTTSATTSGSCSVFGKTLYVGVNNTTTASMTKKASLQVIEEQIQIYRDDKWFECKAIIIDNNFMGIAFKEA